MQKIAKLRDCSSRDLGRVIINYSNALAICATVQQKIRLLWDLYVPLFLSMLAAVPGALNGKHDPIMF